ncbi:MAG: hypothetical protein R3178_09130, partial [Rhodothermales bacterium]|nr:hypothetical protein [Rhodothermales bacterium]
CGDDDAGSPPSDSDLDGRTFVATEIEGHEIVDGSDVLISFDAGTIVITRGHLSTDSLTSILLDISGDLGSEFVGLTTGLTDEGPDVGSPSNELLTTRHVAILTGEGTSAYRAGEVWHLLSEMFEIPVTLLDVGDAATADLSRYTTLIMAGGTYSDLNAGTIKEWVNDGGHLVATGDASLWAVAQELIDADTLSVDLDSVVAGVPYGHRSRARGAQNIGGTILNTSLDLTHPVTFGLEATLPVFRQGRRLVSRPRGDAAIVASYTDDPLLSGYLPARLRPLFGDAASVMTRPMGRGHVIVMAENPAYRGFWLGTNRLLVNAIWMAEAL